MPSRPVFGFTLAEILVVLAIVGVTAAIAVPSFTDALDRRRIRLAAEALRNDLEHARLEAAASGENVRVVPRPHFRGWAGGWTASRGHVPVWASSSEPLHPRLSSSYTRTSISFAPDGAAQNQTITFCARGTWRSALSVVVSREGRVRISPASEDAAASCSR